MTWATSVSIVVFLGLSVSVLDLGPRYATDRRQTASSPYAPPIMGGGIKKFDEYAQPFQQIRADGQTRRLSDISILLNIVIHRKCGGF